MDPLLALSIAANAAQTLNLAVDVLEPKGWFAPTNVRLLRLGPERGFVGGTHASVSLSLRMAGGKPPAGGTPSVLILMHGGPLGVNNDADTWMTRVRLGGYYLFHVPPGVYAMTALYIAAHTSRLTPPPLLAIGEGFSEVVIGHRRTVPLVGRTPTASHITTIAGTPISQQLFTLRKPPSPQRQRATAPEPAARPSPGPNRPTSDGAAIAPAPTTKPPAVPALPAPMVVTPDPGPPRPGVLYQCTRCRNTQRGSRQCPAHTDGTAVAKPPATVPPAVRDPSPSVFVPPDPGPPRPGVLYQCTRCRKTQRGSRQCPEHTDKRK